MVTNVVIDFLVNRQPFAMDAAKLFNLAIDGKAKIYISAVSYNTSTISFANLYQVALQ